MNPLDSLRIFEKANPAGPVVVLIHGGAGGVWTLEEAACLLPDFHCLLPELPEHGSSRESAAFNIQATARSLLYHLEQHRSGRPVHIFGLSVGGQVALEMLALAPAFFASAVISSALVLPPTGYSLGLYSPAAMALVYWLAVAPWKRCDTWIRWSMRVSSGIDERNFEKYRENFARLTPSGWTHAISAYYRYRLPAGLDQVFLPVLLVAGKHETSDAQPTNRLLAGVLPECRSALVGAEDNLPAAREHNWPVNQPDFCARVIRTWALETRLADGLVPAPD